MAKLARWSKPAQDSSGRVINGVWCRVRIEDLVGNPYAQLFSDRDGVSPLPNPFYTTDDMVTFHAVGAPIWVELYTADGVYSRSFRYEQIGRGGESDVQGFTPMGLYSSLLDYSTGDMVTVLSGGSYLLFVSLQDSNLNHTPDSTTPGDTVWWQYMGRAAQLVSTGMSAALSDEITPLVARTPAITMRNFGAIEIAAVRAYLTEASTSGPVQVDINVTGIGSILSTKLTIDQDEKTSVTAAVPPVLSTTSIPDDSEWTIDIDAPGVNAKGLKIVIAAVAQ